MTATSTAASSLPPVRTSCHVPLSLMTSISEETIALWLKLGALEKLEQAVLDGYGDQLCGKTSRIPQVNKFLKQVPLFQNKIREIHQAVSQGRLRDVQHLIDRKKLAFCRDHNGASPLHKAVIFGHQDVIEYLVKRYAGSIHIRDHQGRTALHYAAFLPDRGEIYQYLLANGADERAMDVYGRQPSYYLDGQNESTLRQLRDGSTLNGLRKIKPRYYGQVTTGQPFTNSNRPMVTKSQIRDLISEGNLNALEDLVLQGQGDRLLGETSSVPKIQSFLNIVPMYMERIYDVHRAVMRDQLEHVVILLENKKLAMARDQLGATPLQKAVLFGHYKIAHYISHQFPESLNAIDMEGRTALHYAAALKDNKNMYGILIEAGANKGIYDNKGKTADYYAQYPEHLNLEEVIKRCHKVNANYLANTASRIKGKSPVRQTPPPPSNGNLSSPRSEENNGSTKDTSQSTDSGNENELMTLLQKDKLHKRLDMSSANIRRWVNSKDMDKLTKAVMEGYGDKVVRVNTNEEYEDKEQINGRITEMVERINAIHSAVSSDDLTELQNQLEERDFALAKDHMGNTPLHKSVLLRKTKIVGFLIEKFPETINAKNKNGLTALHYAAAMSRKDGLQLYKMLLQAGADPKIRDNHGRTPDYYKTHLITLPKQGMMRTRPIGGRHSETLNRYSKQGVLERMTTALNRGDVDLLQDLVLEGHGKHLFGKTSWNEDVKNYLKELPSYLNIIQLFHEACKHGDVETVNELAADNEKLMRARDESGALPIHMAAARESSGVLEYFAKNYPSALNSKDTTGKTALHIVSQRGNVTLSKLLKTAGADSRILDNKGKTADFYLHNAIKEGVRTDNDSSKSSINSSSDSSYSITQRESIYKKKSRGRLKNPMFRRSMTEGIEIATTNGVPERNEDIVENTEQEQEDTGNAEESERKESISEADGSKDLDAEEVPINEEADEEENTKDIQEEEEEEEQGEEEKEEEKAEEEENEVEAKDDTVMVDLQTEDTEESMEAEKTEEVAEESATNNEDEDNIETAKENEDDAEEPTADSKEENDDTEVNEDETTENADTALEGGDVDTEETEKDEEKAEDEELKDDHNEEFVEEVNADDTPETEAKEDEEKEEEGEEKEEETEEKGEEEQLDESSSPKDDTDNIEQPGDNDEEAKHESETDEQKEEETEAAEVEAESGEIGDDNTETDNKDNEEEKEDDSGNAEDKDNETDSEGVIVADVGSRNEQSNEDPEKQDTEENANEEETPESTEDNPENREGDKDITESNIEEVENEINEETHEENEDKNDIDTNEEEKNEGDDQDDITEKEDEKEDNANEDVAEEKPEEDKEMLEDESNNTNDSPPDKENEEEMQAETIELKDEAGEEAENNDMNQGEITENGTSNHDDVKTNGHDETPHQTKDHLDELIEHWIKEGDLLRLEHVVLAGQGDRLIERTSDDKQVQDFLDLVPIYMAKIRAVHEAVAKGQLREVRSVLTRKRFALSRDHVGASPLHLAVLHGHTDVSTYIISHFPETMDGPDNEGRTPLHYAAALHDNGTLYRLLKSAGADENIEDKAGHSPKYYMSYPGSLTLETLLEPYSASE